MPLDKDDLKSPFLSAMATNEPTQESTPDAPGQPGAPATHVQYNRRYAPGFPTIVAELNDYIRSRIKQPFNLSDTVSHAVGYYMLCHSYRDLANALPEEMRLSKELGEKKKQALVKEIAALPKARRPKAKELSAILRKERYDIRAYSIHRIVSDLINETLAGTPFDNRYDKCIIQVAVKSTLKDVLTWSPDKAGSLSEFMRATFEHHHKKGYIFEF